ncbi:MAG: response regulator transcription factor [Pseudomonadota bacterium]
MPDTQRFLLLDDHPVYLAGLKHIVEARYAQASVTTSDNARRAIELLDRGERFNVMVVDLNMNNLDGFAFLIAARERRVRARTIVVSGSEDPKDADRAMALGAYAYLSKEAASGTLTRTLDAALDGDDWASDVLLSKKLQPKVDPQPGTKHDLGAQIGLSARQIQVLELICDGMSNKEIGQTLAISEPTVKTHISAIFRLFQVRNRTSVVGKARALGLLD